MANTAHEIEFNDINNNISTNIDDQPKGKHINQDVNSVLEESKSNGISISINDETGHSHDDDDDNDKDLNTDLKEKQPNETSISINEVNDHSHDDEGDDGDIDDDDHDLKTDLKEKRSNETSISINEVNDHSHNDEDSDGDIDDENGEDLKSNLQEKQLNEELKDIDVVENVQPDISGTSGVAEITQKTPVRSRRMLLLSKLPFFSGSKKSKKPVARRLKLYEMFKFADKLDLLLMTIGTIAAITTGAFFPTMLFIYRRVTNSLVDMGKLQANITVDSISSINTSDGCFLVPNLTNQTETPHEAIMGIIKYYIIIGFVSIVCYWIAWACWMLAAERQVRRIRFALFRNILRQEIGWFDVRNAGELSNRLIDDLDKLKNGMNEQVPDFISLLSRMLGALIFALITGWKLTLVYLSISPLIIITFNLIIAVIVKYTIKEVQAFASASSIAQEVLQSIRTVTAFHGHAKEEERFAKNLRKAKKIGIKKGIYMGLCQCLSQTFTFMAFAITFWYGPQLVRTECHNYTAGTVIVVFVACMIATTSTALFIPNFQSFAEALASGSYVFDIIARQTKIDAMTEEGDKPSHINGDIEFENVTFTYPARQERSILNNLSLKIPSGTTVALVGASGCGKSTAIQLIQRFYDPDQGRILLDGKDIKTLNTAWLRQQIGVVSQEPVLFTGSIEENIRFGKPDATDEEVIEAAKMANAHDFIMTFPEEYKTASGDTLSGGQKQRVAIARALISNPKILLLDEATSALDNTSERIVQNALDEVKAGRTTIIIAHRLSTIRNADLIIGLENGKVLECGTHEELMTHKGLYYELVTTQTKKEREKTLEENSDEDEDEVEKAFVRRNSSYARLSKQSISVDALFENIDEYDETSIYSLNKKRKFFGRPFALKILKLNAPECPWILLGTMGSIVFGAVQPVFAFFFAKIYGLFAEADLEKQKHLTSIYAALIFIVGFVGGVAQLLSGIGFGVSGEELTMRMRKLTFSAMIRQEIGYFDYEVNSVGALVTRLSADAASLKGMTGVRIGIILQAISAFVTALIIAFTTGWKLTLIVLCFVPLIMFAGKLQGQKQSKNNQSKAKGELSEQGGQYATQAIEHIRTVVALHQEKHFIDLYEDAFNKQFRKQRFQLHLVAFGAGIANSIVYFLHSATFSYGSKLVEDGEMKFDHVFRIFIVITLAMITVGRSMAMIPGYTKAKEAALRIMRLNNRQSHINPHDDSGIVLKEFEGNIEFRDVHFRYPSRPTLRILKNFSLKCLSSGTTALVGSSGSGKSTTIALLERFYDPLKGKILLDGHDIRALNIRWLRSIIGLVQQEPVLFNLSIRDNIAYGDTSREVTQAEIEAAAKMANIHELITSLPQGYETSCGAKGSQLSGGQKQRIAIARALVRSPKILLLDEATSALDNKSEKVVQTALDKARSGRTCLSIAHRLSTIQDSEKIAVVDRGRMKEEGTHDELLRLNGTYCKLVSAQKRAS